MPRLLQLEDFGGTTGLERRSAMAAPSEPVQAPPEETSLEAYESGYKAGWDDATSAEAEKKTRSGEDFARNLQDMGFTFHEAKAHFLATLEPLLNSLSDTVFPDVLRATLGPLLVQTINDLLRDSSDEELRVVVASSNLEAIEAVFEAASISGVQLLAEPSLADGQAYLTFGAKEIEFDCNRLNAELKQAIKDFYRLANEELSSDQS